MRWRWLFLAVLASPVVGLVSCQDPGRLDPLFDQLLPSCESTGVAPKLVRQEGSKRWCEGENVYLRMELYAFGTEQAAQAFLRGCDAVAGGAGHSCYTYGLDLDAENLPDEYRQFHGRIEPTYIKVDDCDFGCWYHGIYFRVGRWGGYYYIDDNGPTRYSYGFFFGRREVWEAYHRVFDDTVARLRTVAPPPGFWPSPTPAP